MRILIAARHAVLAAALPALLAACGEPQTRGPAAPVDAGESQAPVPADPTGPGWSRVSSGEGAALRLEDGGALIAALSCRADGSGLHVASDRFQPVMSEDRFTVGAGDEAFALVADLESGREEGVEASGDIPADLLDRIAAGEPVAFNYGAQNLGPFPVIPAADARAFVQACREMAQ